MKDIDIIQRQLDRVLGFFPRVEARINTLFGVAVGQVEVDLPAALTFADYARGIDTGMEAIFAAEAERQGHQATE